VLRWQDVFGVGPKQQQLSGLCALAQADRTRPLPFGVGKGSFAESLQLTHWETDMPLPLRKDAQQNQRGFEAASASGVGVSYSIPKHALV
jgi:hypothetical protein